MPTTVATLLGHRHVELAILCLGSLCRYSVDPIEIRLHDDGTLTDADFERLLESLPVHSVFLRGDADERMSEALRLHPACAALRMTNALALKLFDVTMLSDGKLAYCDTDVLFLRPFQGLFDLGSGSCAPLFLRDRQNAYCLRPWDLLRHPNLRVPTRVNSGLIRFDPAQFDLDLLEWYLCLASARVRHVWIEQTAWALLAGRSGGMAVDEGQIAVPDRLGESEPMVGVHLVSSVRSLLQSYVERQRAVSGFPLEIARVSMSACRPWHLALDEARRRWGRLLQEPQ